MVTSQKSSLTLPEFLFERFTELHTTDDGKSFHVFNTLTSEYSKEEIRTIIEDTTLRSIRCSSNERAVDIMVLRALGLRKKIRAPIVLVVRTKQQAKEVLSVLDEQLANARIANLFTQIWRKENYTQFGSVDFILCSYHKLFQQLAKEELVKVSGLVFLAPLSRSNYHTESILLDQILNLLREKSTYTFIHGDELHLRKEDSEWLFAGQTIVYKREEYSRRDLLKDFHLNIFEAKDFVSAAIIRNDFSSSQSTSYLLKLVLSATFYCRKNLKELKALVKQSICYKLWLAVEQSILKDYDDYNNFFDHQFRCFLRYLTDKCNLPLLELKKSKKKKSDGFFYMTDNGKNFFHRFCFSEGLAESQFYILHALSKKLAKGFLSQKDLEELMNDFTNLDIIWDVFYLDDHSNNREVRKVQNNSYSFRSAHDIFEGLDENFGLLAEDAKKNLEAQKKILEEQRTPKSFDSQKESHKQEKGDDEEGELEIDEVFGEGKITKIYSKEFLEKYVLDIVSRENITTQKIAELAQRTGIGVYYLKTTLERLTRIGLCLKIKSNGLCRPEVIYGTEENIAAEPFLIEECGNCVSYDCKTRLCKTNRLKMETAYSNLTLEQLERSNNPIQRTTRACDKYQEASKSSDFTLNFSEFVTYTLEINNALLNDTGNENQNHFKHNCLFCTQEIKAFGSKEKPVFPSKKITCTHCNSKYSQSDDLEKVRCVSDNKNVYRMMMFNELAYIPEILKQKEERIPLTVCDNDILEINIIEGITDSEINFENYFLFFNNRKFALPEVERVYFLGEKHQEIEAELKQLGFKRVYRKKVTKENLKKERKNIEDNSLDPITKSKYQQVIELFRKNGVLINSSLISKINSAITFILAFKNSLSKGKKSKKGLFNKELGECMKILMRAKDDVSDPEAARLLEGQAYNQAFEILKRVGRKAGIRSWGRVVSRLVTWLVFAVFTRTCAYSKLDAMLNHLFKIVLTELKDVHRKVGVDVDLGAGLLHYRKSKSDIDKIGLFLDLVDFVRLIVIFVLAEAISKGEITSKDCRLFLGRGAIPLYDIKLSSLKKFEALAERVLAFKISYKDKEVPLKEAYEDYLKSFKLFLEHLSNRFDAENLEQLPRKDFEVIVNECLQKADCQPISFRIKDFESKLKAIDLCSDEWKFLYEGFEDKFIARRNAREVFQREAMNNLFGIEEMIVEIAYKSTLEKYHISMTKYQKRDRRWSFYILLLFAVKYIEKRKFAELTINEILTFLGLKYKRTRILLNKMLQRDFLKRYKSNNKSFFYFLNRENKFVKILLDLLMNIQSNCDFSNKNSNDCNSKLLTLTVKKYVNDFLIMSPILGIDYKSPVFEDIAKEILAQLNNGVVF